MLRHNDLEWPLFECVASVKGATIPVAVSVFPDEPI